jgi:hypothetical protein
MVRVCLQPFVCYCISGVNIVAKRLFLAPTQVWLFHLKPRISPIFLERHRLRHTHAVDNITFAFSLFRSGPHYPITDLGRATDSWLTGAKRANCEKWVGSKAVVSGHDV